MSWVVEDSYGTLDGPALFDRTAASMTMLVQLVPCEHVGLTPPDTISVHTMLKHTICCLL